MRGVLEEIRGRPCVHMSCSWQGEAPEAGRLRSLAVCLALSALPQPRPPHALHPRFLGWGSGASRLLEDKARASGGWGLARPDPVAESQESC